MHVVFSSCLILLFLLPIVVLAEPEPEQEVLVTATRLPGPADGGLRPVQVVTRQQLDDWSGVSLAEILMRASLVDVQRRGPTQADLSLLGTGFEQVLILVDGVPVNDPQTGHHNMNLPLTADDIERIEILPGVGSSLYGPGAFGGVVHIITRSGTRRQAAVRAAGGSHASVASSLSLSTGRFGDRPGADFSAATRHSAGLQRSDGHRPGTDSQSVVVSQGASLIHPGGVTRLRLGYLNQNFGADGFYGPYPSAEETETFLALISSTLVAPGGIEILPRLSFRQHHDEFLLARTEPSGYQSSHTSRDLGVELSLRKRQSAIGGLVLGAEHSRQRVRSSSLGDHDRQRTGVFGENRLSLLAWLSCNWGLRFDWVDWEGGDPIAVFSPAGSLRFAVGPNLALVLAGGRGFRLPSFTELYYASPANRGDPSLGQERSWAGDLHLDWRPLNQLRLQASALLRWDSGLVDWTKNAEDDPWQASNTGKIFTMGGQFQLRYQPRPDTILELVYARLDMNRPAPAMLSKYMFRQAIDDLALRGRFPAGLGLRASLSARFRRRPQETGDWMVDLRLSRRTGRLLLYLELANLLDTRVEEIPGAPLAGFTAMVGVALDVQ